MDSGDLNLGLLVLRQKVPLLTEPSVQLQKLSTCYGGGGGGGGGGEHHLKCSWKEGSSSFLWAAIKQSTVCD